MESPRLRPVKKDEPVMPPLSCGHPGGMTLDYMDAKKDGTVIITSFCMECFREKFNEILKKYGIEEWKPIAQYLLEGKKITKLWG